MNVQFLFSSPDGDIPVDEPFISRPFMNAPMREHPFLKLGDYFRAIEYFILRSDRETLLHILGQHWGDTVRFEDITDVLIRSEKHGGLYHLASAEICGHGKKTKFVVSTAVSEESREWLTREFETLKTLKQAFGLPYLPEVYFAASMNSPAGAGTATLMLMLGEWFEGYHEWHLHRDDAGQPCLMIWDLENGYRRATDHEAHEIYRQASRILTLYYNLESTHQIYPWLHAAGDFVVRSKGGAVEVRLTTARRYEPLMVFLHDRHINLMAALVYFFLNLTIRMRLDRWEGVGEVAWAEDVCVRPTLEGFLDALRNVEGEGRYLLGKVDDFFSLLKTFQPEDFRRLSVSLLELYRREDPEALSVVERNLEDHCRCLFSTLQAPPG